MVRLGVAVQVGAEDGRSRNGEGLAIDGDAYLRYLGSRGGLGT